MQVWMLPRMFQGCSKAVCVYPPSCAQSLLPPRRTGTKPRQESRAAPGKAGPSVLGALGQCRGANSKFPSCLGQQQPRAPQCLFPGVLLSSLPPVAVQPLLGLGVPHRHWDGASGTSWGWPQVPPAPALEQPSSHPCPCPAFP